ncbi:MAG: UDP-N-acetylmuramoyl-L-alanyl-D-glutamate--2,6-diaminopimelate ligase [Gallionella sp.]|jgi:UDP-N-acetylmuramoyl-L-alanyl-D-glutamate--2,6-diaminopimelate ligase|nr:UDP-N-acetylmuramoyl-L-alanyl-D-glutamate--2,6-diaminopimelate ligase [Gallionella sp.]
MPFPFDQLAALNVRITHLVTDSRLVQRGDTFVAYRGEKNDGRQFIGAAIAQGANAVIHEAGGFVWQAQWDVPHLAVENLRAHAGDLADTVYGRATEKLWMVGVTGTNGKTSTTHWIAHALNTAGKKCALIGTLGNGFVDALQATANTTPEAIQVHKLCADYLHAGARAVAMEVSSHALDQGRINGVHFDVAMLTNLSRDHLDYHGDMQRYAASKRKFFDVQSLRYVVLNLDDETGSAWAEQMGESGVEVVGYGLSDAALQCAQKSGMRMVYGHLSAMSESGLRLAIHSSWGTAQLDSHLVGRFNAENLLGVLAVLLVSGVGLADAVASLEQVQAVAGRMQRLGGKSVPTVIVDYAHTPDALEKVLQTLREMTAVSGGNLICVFGCGGNRDNGKRPMMGRVAEQLADRCIVTSDNPRNESPAEIVAQITLGMQDNKHRVIIDRAAAIHHAIAHAQPGDTVLIAGKGHEDYQEINGVRHPFSDVQVAQLALQNWPMEVRA